MRFRRFPLSHLLLAGVAILGSGGVVYAQSSTLPFSSIESATTLDGRFVLEQPEGGAIFFSAGEPFNLPNSEESLPESPISDSLTDAPPELLTIPKSIVVSRFEFVGNTAFSPSELRTLTVDYINRPITFTELLEVRSLVTQAYVDAGYVTSGAYIPPQSLENGVVMIQIVEGRLEAINVEGEGRLRPEYVRDRLSLAASTPLRVPDLLEALQLLQLNPLIEQISAELAAGTRPGTSVLDVRFKTAKTFRPSLELDNRRSPSVGTFRRTVELAEGNLAGIGDALRAIYRNTDGSDDIDVSYTFPLNPRDGTLRLGYRVTDSTVIEPPFDILDIQSDYRKYELSFRQPIVQTPTEEFAVGITFDHQESQTFLGILDDLAFPISPGSDERGRTQLNALRLFQEWTKRSEQNVFAARSQLSIGLDIFADDTVNEVPPDTRFVTWRGQAQWVHLLGPDALFLARTDMQFANRPLLTLEQFGLGGLDTVRGYRQDQLLTDNGILASFEFRVPVFRVPQQGMVLQLVPFFDVGSAWNSGDRLDPDPNVLASTGLGLRYQISDRLTARFDWGIPLIEAPSRDRTLQEQGLYFSLTYIQPF